MSILIDENTNLLVQGITGGEGSFHTEQMKNYGTNVVAGVTPGKKGQEVNGVPVYSSVKQACGEHRIKASIIFVPAEFAKDAVLEAANHGIDLIVCITENVPVHEMVQIYHYVGKLTDSRLIGPNCPGVISPGKSKVGIMPGDVFRKGKVGIVSRSGTLTYEISSQLTSRGYGQSTVVGIGGDQIVGTGFREIIAEFDRDQETEMIVLVGEIGGSEEERAAEYISSNISTSTIAYIAGFSAPKGKRMGHAGAIVSGEEGTAETKAKVFNDHGIPVAKTPAEIGKLANKKLGDQD